MAEVSFKTHYINFPISQFIRKEERGIYKPPANYIFSELEAVSGGITDNYCWLTFYDFLSLWFHVNWLQLANVCVPLAKSLPKWDHIWSEALKWNQWLIPHLWMVSFKVLLCMFITTHSVNESVSEVWDDTSDDVIRVVKISAMLIWH